MREARCFVVTSLFWAVVLLSVAWMFGDQILERWFIWQVERSEVIPIPNPPDWREKKEDGGNSVQETTQPDLPTGPLIDLYRKIDALVDYAQHMQTALQAAAEIMARVDMAREGKTHVQEQPDGSQEEDPEEEAAQTVPPEPEPLPPLEPESVVEENEDQQQEEQKPATEAKAGRWPYNQEHAVLLFWVDPTDKRIANQGFAKGEPWWTVDANKPSGKRLAEEFGVKQFPAVVEMNRGEAKNARRLKAECRTGICPSR
jgi:hypothetical protein